MANGYNRVIIHGTLGKDIELRTAGETSVTDLRVAVTEKRKIKGEWQEETLWVDVVVWGKLAEGVAKVGQKGSGVLAEGRIERREWEKDGVKRESWRIVADNVRITSKWKGAGERAAGGEDDVPF